MHIHRSPIIALVLALAACFPALEGCSKETSSASTTNAAKPAGLPDRDPALARKLVGKVPCSSMFGRPMNTKNGTSTKPSTFPSIR